MICITNKQVSKLQVGKWGDSNAGEGTICSGYVIFSSFQGKFKQATWVFPFVLFLSQAPRVGSLQLISYLNSSVFLLR